MKTVTRKYVLWQGNQNVTCLLKFGRQRLALQVSNLSFSTQTGCVTFDIEIKYQESDKTKEKKKQTNPKPMHTS